MNSFSHWTLKPRQNVARVFFLSLAVLFFILVLLVSSVAALTIDSARDPCNDGNSVLNCGALTPNEVKTKYDASAAARTIYHYFDISSVDVDNLHSQAVEGRVTAGGRVLVGDKEVATDAVTAGLADMGNSQKVTKNGTTFFVRPPSISFQSASLPAFVMMKDGKFDFAIIASCGNPVKATPVTTKPSPAPAPVAGPTPTPTPPPVVIQTVNVTPPIAATPIPTPTPSPTPTPAPTPQKLPNTGLNVGSLLAFATLATTFSHYAYQKWRIKFPA